MIVSAIRLKHRSSIINNKEDSIICTTSLSHNKSCGLKVANHICLFSISYWAYYTPFGYRKSSEHLEKNDKNFCIYFTKKTSIKF